MGSGIFEDRARAEQAAAESEVWEWFSEALGWTLFMLPAESYLVLSARGGLSAQFMRGSDHLFCEVVGGQERELPWPARFSDYKEVAAQVVAAMRDIQGLWLPMELAARTWTDGHGEDPDLEVLALGKHSVPNLRALAPWALADFARRCRRMLDSDMRVALRGHETRMFLARDLMQSRNAEILAGGNGAWPVRDRTADCIGLVGPDHLLMVDVILDVDDAADTRLDARMIDGLLVERGSDPFARAMVHADPDLRAALANRPELAAMLERDEVWIEYKLITRDTARNLTLSHFRTVDRRRPGAEIAAEDPNTAVRQAASRPGSVAATDPLADVYPLLKPADWPNADSVPHIRICGDRGEVLVVFARDRPSSYELITKDCPEARDDRLRDRAFANLAALHYEWRKIESQLLTVARLSCGPFTSEKVLDPAAMREAHRLLGSDDIFVAVPRRSCLLAFARTVTDSMESVQKVIQLVDTAWADDSYGDAQITRLLFALNDGKPVGFANLDGQASGRRRYLSR